MEQITVDPPFTFIQTTDAGRVRAILTHPRIYPHVTDDQCPPPDALAVSQHPGIHHVLVYHGDTLIGLFVLAQQTGVCYEMHIAMLPNGWGKAESATKSMLNLLWTQTRCQRVIASIPVTNRLAIRLAKSVGARVFGYNQKSILKNGRLTDQVLLGVSRPEGV